ncbi:hypothetical protein OG568_56970 (plasmid) [Streptomyces sp. NBC_01450]|uniref:hypothetical protein n=1 Tax=Streptomyces sp. NBC_01450 TaxID=2903871 RepID=UPI002E33C3A0|nr:hypothetical protein [Streptomyces sp. NBC_01450]
MRIADFSCAPTVHVRVLAEVGCRELELGGCGKLVAETEEHPSQPARHRGAIGRAEPVRLQDGAQGGDGLGPPRVSAVDIDETSSTVAAAESALQRHLVRPLGETRPQRACQCRQFEVRQVGAAAHG